MTATKREQEIIDLDEAGLSLSEIGSKLGVSVRYVKGIVSAHRPDINSDRGFCRMVVHGSRLLLEAIQRERGV